ncbi:MAG: WHG domain-containing protein [Lachnospiraceae bacterium]|nr:WHG domain-containing protein [Lachnospiraceae bacterium]
MPPKVRITKKMVADASFEVIRASGHENLNARTISEYLGCSTQPVLYSFRTVDEIREAAYEITDAYHTAFIMPKDTDENPMLALGLNYVRFGQEEKNLFRFLFQTDKFGGKDVANLMSDPGLSEIMAIMAEGLKADTEQAREMFLTFFCVAHGMASLLANNSMEFDEGQCRKMLETVFYGMVASGKGVQHDQTV